MPAFKDLTGQKFNRLTVIERDTSRKGTYWICKCDCGDTKSIRASNLTTGRTHSCGCWYAETNITHHLSSVPEYQTFMSMKARCYNPKNKQYADYGGRGIRICDEWLDSFETFYADMGTKPSKTHSIDRINVNGIYEKSNCRWATVAEQNSNTRSNRLITHNGITLTLSQWADKTGIHRKTIQSRLENNCSIEEALTTPVVSSPIQRVCHHITCFGKTMTIPEWSSETGIKATTLRRRMFTLGWSATKALTCPLKKR